jgi:hypothetical protein
MSKATPFDVAYDELIENGGAGARAAYKTWRERRGYEGVVEFVTTFTHEYLYRITPEELQDTRAGSEHALGEVRSEEQMDAVEDFTCPFALQHLFHWYIESKRAVPRWQDFEGWIKHDVKQHWLSPLAEHTGYGSADETGRREIARATRWRIGKFYLSAMRELDVLCRLRANYGVDLNYHLIADVLLRVDFWTGNKLLCLYFSNPKYRAGGLGRKPPAESFFRQSRTRFDVLELTVGRQGFGNFWLAPEDDLRRIAEQINAATPDGRAG